MQPKRSGCKPAVFFDKDGTLVFDVPYNASPERIRYCPGADAAIASLHQAGFALFVVTNQPGIAMGFFDRAALADVEAALGDRFAHNGAELAGFYFCPHDGSTSCNCRKPAPGMLETARREHNIDLSCSWLIGDILNDIEAGNRAGCRSILIDNGNETVWLPGPMRQPYYKAANLEDAAHFILADCERRQVAERGRSNTPQVRTKCQHGLA